MKNNFLSPLWYGRLVGMMFSIARRKGIRFEPGEEITLISLFTRVAGVASTEENEILSALLKIYSEKKEAEADGNVVIGSEEEKRLQERGQQEVLLVFRDDRNYRKLLEETDLYAAEEARLAVEKEKARKKSRVIWGLILAFVLGIIVYNLPFFEERRAYRETVRSSYVFKYEDYYAKYPEGRHYQDVMYHEMRISADSVKVMMKYFSKFPSGKYIAELEQRYNAIWGEAMKKYAGRTAQGESPEAVTYINAMLEYMRDNRITTVLVKNVPNITLKDFSEYPESAQQLAELFIETGSLPVKDNMVSLKRNFVQGDREALAGILSQGVEKSFARMFGTDLVTVVTDSADAHEASPVLSFEYTISNQETYGIPSIWTYCENKIPKAYILAISVDFTADFTIPGSDISYRYKESGEPAGEISGIRNYGDGYRRMTQMCFAKFSNVMSENLGLEQTYFRGEE